MQPGVVMKREFFDPSPELLEVIVVSASTLRVAEKLIVSCEACNPDAEIPFDGVLDYVTNRPGSVTDYILVETARCRNCKREIREKTMVALR